MPVCNVTSRLVRDTSFGWGDRSHQLYHANVKVAVFAIAVLVVAGRLKREDDMLSKKKKKTTKKVVYIYIGTGGCAHDAVLSTLSMSIVASN